MRPKEAKRIEHEIVRSPGRDDVHEQRQENRSREGVVEGVPGAAPSNHAHKSRPRHERARPREAPNDATL